MSARTSLLFAALLVLPLPGQTLRNPPSASGGSTDTLVSPRSDSMVVAPLGTPVLPALQDSLSRPKSRADTVLVVKHRFNHREQIITGSVVMTCLALMMVVMNNYNPR